VESEVIITSVSIVCDLASSPSFRARAAAEK
jgi:hypothetical protein